MFDHGGSSCSDTSHGVLLQSAVALITAKSYIFIRRSLITAALQHGQSRVFRETWIGGRALAQVERRSPIRANFSDEYTTGAKAH